MYPPLPVPGWEYTGGIVTLLLPFSLSLSFSFSTEMPEGVKLLPGDGRASASRSAAICDTDLRGVGIETDVDLTPWPGVKRGWN